MHTTLGVKVVFVSNLIWKLEKNIDPSCAQLFWQAELLLPKFINDTTLHIKGEPWKTNIFHEDNLFFQWIIFHSSPTHSFREDSKLKTFYGNKNAIYKEYPVEFGSKNLFQPETKVYRLGIRFSVPDLKWLIADSDTFRLILALRIWW